MGSTATTNTHATADAFYAAMAAKDLAAVQAHLGDNIVAEIPGRSGIAGTFHGPRAVLDLFATLAEHSRGTYRFEIEAITADEGIAVTVGRATGSADGRALDQDAVHVLRVVDGRITSLRALFADQAMTDAFWS
jgi:uncharacterized protein